MSRDFQLLFSQIRIQHLVGLFTVQRVHNVYNFFLKCLGNIKFWYKNFAVLIKAVGFTLDWCLWIRGFVWSEKEFYWIKHKSTMVRTLASPDPKAVSDWCRRLTKQIKEEGVARAGTICVFIPKIVNKKEKQVGRSSDFCYLVVFVPPDNCLVVSFNDKCSIPEPVSKLFCMSNIVFYVESPGMLKRIMHRHCVYKWAVPRNVKGLEKLFKSNHSSQTARGLTFLKIAERSTSGFTYKVPGWLIATNWGEATLRQKEIQYLTMRCYSGFVVASEMGWTNGSFLIKVLAKSKGPLSDSESSVTDDDV